MTELDELSILSQVALTAERFEDASKYIENLIKNKNNYYILLNLNLINN